MLSKNKIAFFLLIAFTMQFSACASTAKLEGKNEPPKSIAGDQQQEASGAGANGAEEFDYKKYDPPQRLKLNGAGESDTNNANNPSANLLTEKFYPIGWSKDGNFAYYTEPPDEACGCYFAELVIQDLRTDKILWKYSNTREEIRDDDNKETIENYWKNHHDEFAAKLAEYKIVPQKKFNLLASAINYQTDVLTPQLAVDVKNDVGIYADGDVALSLVSQEKGSKTLYRKKYEPKDVSGFQGAEGSGSLMSPFEARAAVVLVEIYRGYEGPPNTTRVKIVGAALTTGFQQ